MKSIFSSRWVQLLIAFLFNVLISTYAILKYSVTPPDSMKGIGYVMILMYSIVLSTLLYVILFSIPNFNSNFTKGGKFFILILTLLFCVLCYDFYYRCNYIPLNENSVLDPERIFKNHDKHGKRLLAESPMTSTATLKILSKENDISILCGLAKNPNIPVDLQQFLSTNKIYHVRECLVLNPNLSPEILQYLKNDSDERVRNRANFKKP